MSLAENIDSLINDLAVGLNESTLKSRLLILLDQAEAQDAHLKELEAEVTKLQSKTQAQDFDPEPDELEEGAIEILKLLFGGAELSAIQTAAKLGMTKGMSEYHCSVLFKKEMIYIGGFGRATWSEPSPTSYVIGTKGRAYLVKHGLVQ